MLIGIWGQGRKMYLSFFGLAIKWHISCYKLEHSQKAVLSAVRYLHRLFKQIAKMWEGLHTLFTYSPKHLHWGKVGHCFVKLSKNVIKNRRSWKDCPESRLRADSWGKLSWRVESITAKNVLVSFFACDSQRNKW